MAHPKRKTSKSRRDKRRTHYKAVAPQIAKDPTTGEAHLYHRAHWHEGKLYYRGHDIAYLILVLLGTVLFFMNSFFYHKTANR